MQIIKSPMSHMAQLFTSECDTHSSLFINIHESHIFT